MGCADLIPGVSGGTIAYITGIYARLVNAINAIDYKFFRKLLTFKIKESISLIDWVFLIPLFLGIASAILSLSGVIKFLLESYRWELFSFFMGMIASSAIIIVRNSPKIILGFNTILFGTGIVIGFLITGLLPGETPGGFFYMFFSGSLASIAMILPGISGSFILLILGKYETILNAIHTLPEISSIIIVAVVALGVVFGLLAFSKVLAYLLNNFENRMMAVLCGLMLGSLRKLWPWKLLEPNLNESDINAVNAVIESNKMPSFESLSDLTLFIIFMSTFMLSYFLQVILIKQKK